MPDRTRTPKRDANQSAFDAVEAIRRMTEGEDPPETKHDAPSDGKNAAAVALGRRGGLKGGKARAAKMSKEERQESARKAAKARWGR